MNARFDRVIRKGTADGKNVYSLCLTPEGLYVFFTGVVGGLVLDHSDDTPRQIVVDDHNMPLIESMIKSEARVQSLPPEELVRESGHQLLTFDTLIMVHQQDTGLTLESAQETFEFYFTLSKDKEVAELAERIAQYIEESHADT